MNDIIKLLNLEDENIIIEKIDVVNMEKIITISKPLTPMFCPICNCRMHSKGIYPRTVNHPVMQDGYTTTLNLNQRRWSCTNKACGETFNDEFKFIEPRKRNTKITDFLVLQEFKLLSNTATDIANKFNISDTQALTIFDKYVAMQRLPLSEYICIDEVFLDMDSDGKYALVLIDFVSGEIIDLVTSRVNKITEPYFTSIPKVERFKVKYLISDMYAPYFEYVNKYFPNAVSVVDSFHVIQWICNLIDRYLISLLKKYKEKDQEKQLQKEKELGHPVSSIRSKEVYLLQNHRWIMLSNSCNINYNAKSHYDRVLRQQVSTYVYEDLFFNLLQTLENCVI